MNYTISKPRRNAIILCSLCMILYILILRLFFFFNGLEEMNSLQVIVLNMTYIILYGSIMLAIFDYFRHYKFKALKISILIMLISEVVLKSRLFSDMFESTWEKAAFLAVNVTWILSTMTMIAYLFQVKTKECPGILSIRRYAISILFFYVLVTTVPLFVKLDSIFSVQQLVETTFVIPYIFAIDFATKISPLRNKH